MLLTYLPTIVAIIVAIITAYANYRIGKLKANIDVKTVINNASDALRDDLLALIDKYEKRESLLLSKIDQYDEQNRQLKDTINTLRIEVTDLRIENQGLKAELQRTRADLEAFDRKVYYVPTKPQE